VSVHITAGMPRLQGCRASSGMTAAPVRGHALRWLGRPLQVGKLCTSRHELPIGSQRETSLSFPAQSHVRARTMKSHGQPKCIATEQVTSTEHSTLINGPPTAQHLTYVARNPSHAPCERVRRGSPLISCCRRSAHVIRAE